MQKNNKGESHTPDWDKIRNEYISTNISLRKLASKYSITPSVVMTHCQKEGWAKEKEQIKNETRAESRARIIAHKANHADESLDVFDTLINRIREMSQTADKAADVKALVSALKDLSELGVLPISERDNSVTVSFEEGEDYAD